MKKIQVFIICLLVSRLVWAQAGIPKLNSWTPPGDPKDVAVIYLDFDGHFVDFYSVWTDYWGGGAMFAEPCHFTPQQVREAWQIVAEDFAPFQVNVTTDSLVYQNARYDKRVRVVLTNTDHWRPKEGGVAFYNSITFGDDTPVWVFPRRLGNAKAAGDCASHEAGHALDLVHHGIYDDKCNWVNSYNPGGGAGEVTWAPIMGASYNVNLGTWDNQERDTTKCPSIYRDDIERITRYFPFKKDDHPDQQGEGVQSLIQPAKADVAIIQATGLITHRHDIDVFRFTATSKSRLVLRAKGVWANHAPLQANNLDLKIELWKDGGPHQRYAPLASVEVHVDSVVDAGTYFISVSGDGNAMMSNYGSLGNYEISGELRQKLVQVNLGRDTAICSSTPYVLDAGNPGAQYLWSTGATTRTIPVISSNTYAVTVSMDDYRVSDTIRVEVVESVLVDFDVRMNKPTCSLQQVSFEDKSVAVCSAKRIVSRSWVFNNENGGDAARVSRSFQQGSQEVTLRITDSDNKTYTRTRRVDVSPLLPPQHFTGPDVVELCAGNTHTFDLS